VFLHICCVIRAKNHRQITVLTCYLWYIIILPFVLYLMLSCMEHGWRFPFSWKTEISSPWWCIWTSSECFRTARLHTMPLPLFFKLWSLFLSCGMSTASLIVDKRGGTLACLVKLWQRWHHDWAPHWITTLASLIPASPAEKRWWRWSQSADEDDEITCPFWESSFVVQG
jgi:hypothetical protein